VVTTGFAGEGYDDAAQVRQEHLRHREGQDSSEETLCVAKYGATLLHCDMTSSGDVKWRLRCYRMTRL